MENKGQTVFLSVVGIATLIVAIIGATFAYFTTGMTGSNASVSATTAKVGAISFTADAVSATAVLPGWSSGTKNVKVTLGPSDVAVKYTCTLNMTANPLTDLTLTLGGTNAVSASAGTLATGAKSFQIASGTINASATSQTVTTTYQLSFPETGADQTTQAGKSIAGTVSCATEGTKVYYNNSNTTGTTTAPTK